MGVELKSNYSLYSKENLEFLSEKVGGEKDSLKEFADTNKENIFTKFGKYLLDESVKLNSDSVMKEEKSKYTDFSQIDKDYKNKVIEERSKFFQEKFLPFLKNPADMETKISLKKCDQVENDADWRNCFKKDDIQKSLEYRNKWYELASEETKEIIEKSGKNKKNKSNNDSGDHEEVFSKDDRYEAAKERIEKLKDKYENYKYENNNRNILEDFKEDYSTTTFLKELNKFLGKSDNNPLGGDSNLQKFLDANFSQLKKVLGSLEVALRSKKSLGSKGSSEEGDEDDGGDEGDEGDGEKSYLKNLKEKASSDSPLKEVKEIYNVKKVLLQYLFDMANMDLDFCYGKVKICSEGSESEENNDKENEENEEDEDENENSDNGIFSKISIGLKMGSEYIKGKLQQGYGTLIKNFYDIDSYDNYCGFLVNMISNLGKQIEDIGAVNVDSEDKEEEKKTDNKNKNENENSAGGNESAKKIFYDPYWYINELSKSDDSVMKAGSWELRKYYIERAKIAKLYEYIDNEKNVDPKKIVEKMSDSKLKDLFFKSKKSVEYDDELKNLFFNSVIDPDVPDYYEILNKKADKLKPDDLKKFKNKCILNISKEISEIKKQIKRLIISSENKIDEQVNIGKTNCENKNKERYSIENKAAEFLSEAKEFENSEEEFKNMSFISNEDYFKSTGELVLKNLNKWSVDFYKKIKEIEEKILGKEDKITILSREIINKVKGVIIKLPDSYNNIEKDKRKYFNTDLLKKDILKQENKTKTKDENFPDNVDDMFDIMGDYNEQKNKQNEKENEQKEIDNKFKDFYKNAASDSRFKGVRLRKKGSILTPEERRKVNKEKVKGIVEEAGKEGTLEGFWKYLGVKDIGEKDKIYKTLKEKHPDLDEKQYDQIYEGLQTKYNDLKNKQDEENRKKEEERTKEAEARNTPEKFLGYLAEKFEIKGKDVMKELEEKLVKNRERDKDANAKNSEKIYEKLKNRYEELKQKESEKAAEAFQKSLAEEAPPKKLLRDFYTPKESYKIDSLLFTEKKENLVSYDKYVIMANDENPSPRRYLSFLGMRDISELEAAYKNFETYSDKEKYKANLDYYKKQYGEAITRQSIEYHMGQINQIKTKTSPLALPDDNYYKNQEEQTSKKK